MTNCRKHILVVAAVATAAGFGYIKSSHRNIPSDLRDAVVDKGFDTSIPSFEKGTGNIQEPKAAAFEGIDKGYVAGNDPSAGAPARPVEWVAIPAGKFMMGTDSGEKGFEDAKPIHEVTIKTFDMSKTAVTVEQYAECVIKGGCKAPAGNYCNWGKTNRQFHPVNCVDWDQAQAYAKFKGARLPSEAEFEYAATSGGKNQKYPWGNDIPTSELAVFYANGTMPVCSKPNGNTAQGLCDMSGNVWQWMQDKYQDSYKGVPTDGSAFEGVVWGVQDDDREEEAEEGRQSLRDRRPNTDIRVFRGGSFNGGPSNLRADYRGYFDPGHRGDSDPGYFGPGCYWVDYGFRLVRSSR